MIIIIYFNVYNLEYNNIIFFSDYLSQFNTTNYEKKCKNNIQLAVDVQLNKLNKGRNNVNFIIIIIIIYDQSI